MKRLLPSLLAVIFASATNAQITQIPDSGFEQALVNLGLDNAVDGGVLTANIDTVTHLDVGFLSIADLSGIQDFTSLTVLEIEFNQLTSLDLSNMTALVSLYADFNQQLTSLDISGNSALTTLWCRGCQLDTIDVTTNNALISLELSLNNLTGIDVSNNTALNELYIGSNQLSNLDVTNNTALEYLFCDNNQLSSLDVSNNTVLNWLSCYSNPLYTLDVSHNSALTFLNCGTCGLTNLDVTNNIALTDLDLQGNNLTSLDVTKNTALEGLNFHRNAISTLDLTQNTALEALACSENSQLTSLYLVNNSNLKTLICKDNSQLNCLNLKNGNNSALTWFAVERNPNLTCITVDDVAFSNANWNIDAQTSFSTNCSDLCSSISVSEFSRSEFEIYPNPVLNQLTIDAELPLDEVSILDGTGKVIMTRTEESRQLDVSFLPAGIYFIRIRMDQTIVAQKFVKK